MAFGQQPKHSEMILGLDLAQRLVTKRDHRRRASVVAVGLVAAARVEEPHPSRQGRRDIDDAFPGSDELLGQQRPGPCRALDGPQPRRERSRPLQQPVTLPAIGGHPKLVENLLGAIEHRRRVGAPMRVDPDDEHVVLLSN